MAREKGPSINDVPKKYPPLIGDLSLPRLITGGYFTEPTISPHLSQATIECSAAANRLTGSRCTQRVLLELEEIMGKKRIPNPQKIELLDESIKV